ncbi:hypothetical protein NDU88_007400 [Pleurodeles waltl]|uniref:Uncharacterized protein n=1 Tax=Pleurodeles waltl TaxID=8319 RepID=A0AAV7RSB9_PLEWA|nr:hypothetical protein NDU88_007400 [Pleurodeles waltl]
MEGRAASPQRGGPDCTKYPRGNTYFGGDISSVCLLQRRQRVAHSNARRTFDVRTASSMEPCVPANSPHE